MIKRRLLYSVPIGLVGLGALLMAIPAGAQATPTPVLTVQNGLGFPYVSTATASGGATPVTDVVAGSNVFQISVTDNDVGGTVNGNTGAQDTLTVTVKSGADSTGITRTLTETTNTSGVFTANVNVVTTNSVPNSDIKVADGNTITVTYTKGAQSFSSTLTVDSTAPGITAFSPLDGTAFPATTLQLAVTATDGLSGFRPDSSGTTNVNEAAENATFTLDGVVLTTQAASVDANGVLNASVSVTPAAGNHQWFVVVRDRAGNTRRVDQDTTTTTAENLTFEIDNAAPTILSAKTGLDLNATGTNTTANRRAVEVLFTETDRIDSATVEPSDFSVGGQTPSSVKVPAKREAYMAAGQFPVYLIMGSDLAPDAKPVVQLVGQIRDRAGNQSPIGQVTATDGIAPKLTLTVAGDAANRPVSRSKLVVTVTSDEALQASPTIVASHLQRNAGLTQIDQAAGFPNPTVTSAGTNTWTAEFTIANLGGTSGLVNFYAEGNDSASNLGKVGQGNNNGTGTNLDIAKAVLGEFDNRLSGGTAPTFVLGSSPAAGETDALRPFVQVTFGGEANEYPITDNGGNNPLTSIAPSSAVPPAAPNSSDNAIRVDSHSGVTITKATFGIRGQTGSDVTTNVQRTGTNSFIFLPSADLTLGSQYTLTVQAKDDAGNVSLTAGSTTVQDFSFNFTVVAPKEFTINLVPGWNLISFPDNPQTQGINDVFGGNAGVKQVLTYDANDPTGPWLVSMRGENGTLSTGQIVNITASRAYWVEATTFEAIKVVIPRRQASTTAGGLQPPQIMVKKGWNLVPVIDPNLNNLGTNIAADTYFGTTAWSFAYTFDTTTGAWTRVNKGVGDNVQTGKAYWLYVTADGLLVP